MEVIGSAIEKATKYMMTMTISDFIDIIIVAYLLYKIAWFVRKTNSNNLAKGIVLILIALWVSDVANLMMINYVLRKAAELGLIALLILFQPELRNLLAHVGRTFSNGKSHSSSVLENAITQTVAAVESMSQSKTGALIIIERAMDITTLLKSRGTVINADVTAELIKNIFFNKAPLHDGALIIRNCKLAEAGAVLPLTERTNLSAELGTRHRAGIGMSENSDAVVIIVSEETGAISVAMDGMLKRHLTPTALDALLHQELVEPEDDKDKRNFWSSLNWKNIKKALLFWDNGENEEDKQDEKTL